MYNLVSVSGLAVFVLVSVIISNNQSKVDFAILIYINKKIIFWECVKNFKNR